MSKGVGDVLENRRKGEGGDTCELNGSRDDGGVCDVAAKIVLKSPLA
jgi:hypothetical protein